MRHIVARHNMGRALALVSSVVSSSVFCGDNNTVALFFGEIYSASATIAYYIALENLGQTYLEM